MDEDATLLGLWAERRDAEAFAILSRRYIGMVHAVCLRILRNAHDAEDAAQECFVLLARQAGTVRSSVAGWLHATATTVALQSLRSATRRRRREQEAAVRPRDDDHPTWAELAPHVDEAIAALDPVLREVLVRRYLSDQTQDVIAADLGVDRSTIARRLQQAVAAVRERLARRGVIGAGVSVAALGACCAQAPAIAPPAALVAGVGKLAVSGAAPASAFTTSTVLTGKTAMTAAAATLALAVAGTAVHLATAADDWRAGLPTPVEARGEAGPNLLRNGSFEVGMRYWHDIKGKELVAEDAAHGKYALRIPKGLVQSAAFELKRGQPVTIAFSARAEAPATMGWQCTPCARELGTKHGLCWGLAGKHPVKVGTAWQRFTFTFTPEVPQDGFWPRPTYMLQLGDGTKPILIDAVTVMPGKDTGTHAPWRPVEVSVECPELKGYTDPAANILDRDATVTLTARLANHGETTRNLTLRWQLFDYEGRDPVGPPVVKAVTVPAGGTLAVSTSMMLTATGTVLARAYVLDGGQVVDRSDLPLTTLPHPLAATEPDQRERFGGSLWGPHVGRQHQRMGLSWTRWRPHMNWADHQPKGPDAWHWFDKELDELQAFGISTHAVLYGKPKWAFAKESDQLPKDMVWPADDKRWDDLTPQCGWDRFVVEAVKHYQGRSLVYEIENEPELDGWNDKQDLYARFTIRTARLIKATDPKAQVQVDNVYGIPSGLNRHMLVKGGAPFIDHISWHDYHDGWLTDASAIRRMRLDLDALGGQHIGIWFNEGWTYTNTAVDEPAVALTRFDAAQATNHLIDCIAEATVAGQDKTILFHTGYEHHGMSFWDYCGPGTMLWDWYGHPLPIIPAWNMLAFHIGLSERVGLVRPPGANTCVFQDLRNDRGVVVAYADRGATSDAAIDLPDVGSPWQGEDAMGNPLTVAERLTLSRTGRPVFLFTAGRTPGATLHERLVPLDRKHAGFAAKGAGGATIWSLPPAWDGLRTGASDGSVAMADGRPVWRLEQVWPPDPSKTANYRPMVWNGTTWRVAEGDFGGQPAITRKDDTLNIATRAPHGKPPQWRTAALVFVPPAPGTYVLHGRVEARLWENGKAKTTLLMMKRDGTQAVEIDKLVVPPQGTPLDGRIVTLGAGEELVLLPRIDGMYAGGDCRFIGLSISSDTSSDGKPQPFTLPASWTGSRAGATDGNPLLVAGQARWRCDQVWPDEPMLPANYTPLIWRDTGWQAVKNAADGKPLVQVTDGTVTFALRGAPAGQQRGALAFIIPGDGTWTVSGSVRTEGASTTPCRLALLKKDTQRAAEVRMLELPRDGSAMPFTVSIVATAGHELLFLPDAGRSSADVRIRIENLRIAPER